MPGIQISEHLPQFAKLTNDAAIIRSMSTSEGAHGRARYYMHTGYKEGVGGLVYPSLGSIVSAELGKAELPAAELRRRQRPQLRLRLPRAAASTAVRQRPGPRRREPQAAGRRRPVRQPRRSAGRDGVGLPPRLQGRRPAPPTRRPTTGPSTLMQSKEAKAFDLSASRPSRKAAYGDGKFGEGCLLARRLVETGVPFVEVDAGRLGHAPGQLQPRQEAVAAGRPGDVRPDHRPQGPRPARRHAGHLDGRVRPHAEDHTARRQARPRPLPARLEHGHGRRRHQGRPGHRQDRRRRRRGGRAARSRPSTSWPASARCSASTTTSRTTRRSAARSASWTRAASRSRNFSRERIVQEGMIATQRRAAGARECFPSPPPRRPA